MNHSYTHLGLLCFLLSCGLSTSATAQQKQPSPETNYIHHRLAPEQSAFRVVFGPTNPGDAGLVDYGVKLNYIDGKLLGDGQTRLFNQETLGVDVGVHKKFSVGAALPVGFGRFGGVGNPKIYGQFNILGLGKLQAAYRISAQIPLRDGAVVDVGLGAVYRYTYNMFAFDAGVTLFVDEDGPRIIEVPWRLTAQLTDGLYAGIHSQVDVIATNDDRWQIPAGTHVGYTLHPGQFIPALDLAVSVTWPRLMYLTEPNYGERERFTFNHVTFMFGVNTHIDFTR